SGRTVSSDAESSRDCLCVFCRKSLFQNPSSELTRDRLIQKAEQCGSDIQIVARLDGDILLHIWPLHQQDSLGMVVARLCHLSVPCKKVACLEVLDSCRSMQFQCIVQLLGSYRGEAYRAPDH